MKQTLLKLLTDRHANTLDIITSAEYANMAVSSFTVSDNKTTLYVDQWQSITTNRITNLFTDKNPQNKLINRYPPIY